MKLQNKECNNANRIQKRQLKLKIQDFIKEHGEIDELMAIYIYNQDEQLNSYKNSKLCRIVIIHKINLDPFKIQCLIFIKVVIKGTNI